MWTWLLPGFAFLAGVVLGGVVVAAGNSGGDPDSVVGTEAAGPANSAPASANPRATGDFAVRVPGACLDAIDAAERAAHQIDDVVAAVRQLDAERLRELVDRFQHLQPELEGVTTACGDISGKRVGGTAGATPAPARSRS